MSPIFVFFAAVLALGPTTYGDVPTQKPFASSGFSGILSGLTGQNSGILNGLQSSALIQGLQDVLLEFPGSLLTSNNQTLDELKLQCLTHSNQSVLDEVEVASGNLHKCVGKSIPSVPSLISDEPEELCKNIHKSVYKCVIDYTKTLELCMDAVSAYVPGYNVEVFDSIFKFLCDKDADNIMALLMSLLQPNGCLQKTHTITHECLSQTERFTATLSAAFRNITQPQLCSDTALWKNCVIENVRTPCTADMYDLVIGLTKAVYVPCSGSKLLTANTFVFVIVLFISKSY